MKCVMDTSNIGLMKLYLVLMKSNQNINLLMVYFFINVLVDLFIKILMSLFNFNVLLFKKNYNRYVLKLHKKIILPTYFILFLNY